MYGIWRYYTYQTIIVAFVVLPGLCFSSWIEKPVGAHDFLHLPADLATIAYVMWRILLDAATTEDVAY